MNSLEKKSIATSQESREQKKISKKDALKAISSLEERAEKLTHKLIIEVDSFRNDYEF